MSRLVNSAPNITLGEMEYQMVNELHPIKKRKEYSHGELTSAFHKPLITELHDKNLSNQTPENHISIITKPKLSYYIKLLLAATVVLVLGCFTGFHLSSLMFPKNIKQYMEQPKYTNSEFHKETKKTDTISGQNSLNTLLQPVEIHAKSYTEYQANMYAIPDNQPVSVVIELSSPEDWPRQAQLARAEQVTTLKIRGQFSVNMLAFILGSLKNLVGLTIISSENKLCDRFDHEELGNLSLYRLRYLAFVNFTRCSNIFDIFAKSPRVSGIRQLKMENGVVSKDNMESIRAIVLNSRQSLRKLCFPDTKWETTLLTEEFPLLSNLTLFRMDFITLNSTELDYINTKLANIFPNLVSFISIKGFAPWNNFRNLMNMNSLEILRCGIKIPKDRKEFKLNFLESEFQCLKQVHLSLNFVNSSELSSSCSIHGMDTIRRSLKSLEIQTTCEIHLNSNQKYMSNRSKRHLNQLK